MIGIHCPINMFDGGEYVCVLSTDVDAEGYPTGERINGFYRCPQCGLWWPVVEEPDGWTETEAGSGVMEIDSWWGAAVCLECELLMIEQPDGMGECYDLSE